MNWQFNNKNFDEMQNNRLLTSVENVLLKPKAKKDNQGAKHLAEL